MLVKYDHLYEPYISDRAVSPGKQCIGALWHYYKNIKKYDRYEQEYVVPLASWLSWPIFCGYSYFAYTWNHMYLYTLRDLT